MPFSSKICSLLTLCPLALPFNFPISCLLFLLHPLPHCLSFASSSSLQPPPILSLWALPPENEKFSEIQMCPDPDKDCGWVWVSSIVSTSGASINDPSHPPCTYLLLLHIFSPNSAQLPCMCSSCHPAMHFHHTNTIYATRGVPLISLSCKYSVVCMSNELSIVALCLCCL